MYSNAFIEPIFNLNYKTRPILMRSSFTSITESFRLCYNITVFNSYFCYPHLPSITPHAFPNPKRRREENRVHRHKPPRRRSAKMCLEIIPTSKLMLTSTASATRPIIPNARNNALNPCRTLRYRNTPRLLGNLPHIRISRSEREICDTCMEFRHKMRTVDD